MKAEDTVFKVCSFECLRSATSRSLERERNNTAVSSPVYRVTRVVVEVHSEGQGEQFPLNLSH